MPPSTSTPSGPVTGAAERRGRTQAVRRRPSGEPPPLPREDHWTRWIWVLAGVLLLGAGLNLLVRSTEVIEAADQAVLSFIAEARTPVLTDAAKVAVLPTTFVAVMALRLGTVVVLVVYGRFRHLVVFLATLVVTDWIVVRLLFVELPRPEVPALVEVDAYAFPPKAISTLTITLFAMAFVLLPRGGTRNRLRAGAVAVLALVVLAELYLAGDHLSAMLYAAVLAPSVAAVTFRSLVPEEGFPISYRKRGSVAHLDLGGERGKAIVAAMADQLGLTVTEVKEFGLEGSGGSSPLRMTLPDGSRVFGKIYSTAHERADRWYRFGRTILYGQLEDETAVGSVRRLAAYEDYALRLLADHGVQVAKTYGLVELTPNQEYMLVTEFFENARNLGDSQVDEVVIDEGLAMVRTFWDVGVAHRDIKPANLLVQNGHLQLVDVSALEVRPSPWRQAVDLSNMLLTLALRTDPELVYQRATKVFTPDEIAEALASAVGLTIPTELQAKLKADGRPLLDRFRRLAPPRERISIQRWSTQRLLLTAGAALGTLLLVGLFLDRSGPASPERRRPPGPLASGAARLGVQDAAGDLDQGELAVHRGAAHAGVGLVLGETELLHQAALCPLDDLAVGQLVLEVLDRALQLAAVGGPGEGDAHPGQELGRLERLDQVADGAGVGRLLDQLLVGEGGEHQHGRPVGGDLPGGREAVQLRHLHVHDHQVRVQLAGEPDRLLPVAGLADHGMAPLLQGLHDVDPDHDLVLGDKHPRHLAPLAAHAEQEW
jgi:hypothetical protein